MYKVGDKVLAVPSSHNIKPYFHEIQQVTRTCIAILSTGERIPYFPKHTRFEGKISITYYHESTEHYKNYLKRKEV